MNLNIYSAIHATIQSHQRYLILFELIKLIKMKSTETQTIQLMQHNITITTRNKLPAFDHCRS